MVPLAPTHAIFDLDGTLLDTEPLYTLAAQRVVSKHGKVFDFELKREIMGGGPLAGAVTVVERLNLPITPETYLSEREEILVELCRGAPALRGAQALVEALHERGIPLAIGTSSDQRLCELKLAPQPFRHRFRVVVCSDDPEVRAAKPAPDIFLVAAARLGAEPRRCIVFEDSPKGVQAARAAGMQAIAIPDPRWDPEEFAGALRVVASLEEVTLADLGLA